MVKVRGVYARLDLGVRYQDMGFLGFLRFSGHVGELQIDDYEINVPQVQGKVDCINCVCVSVDVSRLLRDADRDIDEVVASTWRVAGK